MIDNNFKSRLANDSLYKRFCEKINPIISVKIGEDDNGVIVKEMDYKTYMESNIPISKNFG